MKGEVIYNGKCKWESVATSNSPHQSADEDRVKVHFQGGGKLNTFIIMKLDMTLKTVPAIQS